jgi:hypothetical protein
MSPSLSYSEITSKNLREFMLDVLCGNSSTGLSELSLRSVTGPITVDEDNNIDFGELIDVGTLVRGPTKIDTGSPAYTGYSLSRDVEFIFKFDTYDEERKRVKYYVFMLGNKIVKILTPHFGLYVSPAPLSKGYPYYIKVRVRFGFPRKCDDFYNPFNRVARLMSKKAYTVFYGAIDGAPEADDIDCKDFLLNYVKYVRKFGPFNDYTVIGVYHQDFIEALVDACLDGSAFMSSITIYSRSTKNVLSCQCYCMVDYLSQIFNCNKETCFSLEDSTQTLSISGGGEKSTVRCSYSYSYGQNENEKLEICRYIFPVPGDSSKFMWQGLLVSNYVNYIMPQGVDPRIPFDNSYLYGPLNLRGKPIKIVMHFYINHPYVYFY